MIFPFQATSCSTISEHSWTAFLSKQRQNLALKSYSSINQNGALGNLSNES
jgi:hypothetical protein